MFKKLRKNKKGFTLVELIVVIAILAVLAAVLVPTMIGVVGNAEEKTAQAQITAIRNAYNYITLSESGTKTVKTETADTKTVLSSTGEATEISEADIIAYFDTELDGGDFQIELVSSSDTRIKSITYKKVTKIFIESSKG